VANAGALLVARSVEPGCLDQDPAADSGISRSSSGTPTLSKLLIMVYIMVIVHPTRVQGRDHAGSGRLAGWHKIGS